MTENFNVKRLREIELELLGTFINVCNQLDIKYYVIGGTALGTIRHKGFIPWDDDIDVGMMRDDYDYFINYAQNLMPDNIFLQTFRTDPEYPLLFAKLRNSNTTFIETSLSKLNINHGVYLDIFPLDYYPINHLSQLYLKALSKIIEKKVFDALSLEKSKRNISFKQKIFQMIYKLLSLKYDTTQEALLDYESKIRKVKKTDLIKNYFGAWGDKEIVSIQWFNDGIKMPFESYDVIVPSEYDKYLNQLYGEYMKFPPKEKQISHHYTDIIDLDKSYTEYMQ